MKQIKLPLKFKQKVYDGMCSCWHHPNYVGYGNYLEFPPWWKFWGPRSFTIKCPLCEDGSKYKDVWEVEKEKPQQIQFTHSDSYQTVPAGHYPVFLPNGATYYARRN